MSVEDGEPPGSTTAVLSAATSGAPGAARWSQSRPGELCPSLETRDSIPAPPESPVLEQRISARSRAFRRRFYPEATNAEWCDWAWQVRHRIEGLAGLERVLRLSDDERRALTRQDHVLPVAVTPYYLSLLDAADAAHPLRRTVIPVEAELVRSEGEEEDPLGEENQSPVHCLVHRYPDRVLFLVTRFCSVYCRFCTRSRLVGHRAGAPFSLEEWGRAIEYIAATPTVRDVLISGGDPLTLSDERLEWLLSRLRAIEHVEIIRLGTKVPAVLPQRVTPALVRMLRKYHPLWMSLHFTHPDELTPEAALACTRLADAGIPLGSQTVLMAGVNDSVGTMTRLVHGLMRIRVRPYYLYQCDPIVGSAHFRTPVEKGLEIIQGLRGHTSGYAVPHYVIDAPGGGGKIPLLPEYYQGREGNFVLLRNFEGKLYRYPDPLPSDT
ncbi:MAG TPA: KamA family radical SAM protein [Planctomycetota bacterium]|nr:KamA family radical SAM protein [Planctomycetota bacterium]HRR81459.1 KamA family radical SAM protein [Planctomycetota bacterium]HRT93536.1 KamA family radical SAM protein [Planctomycetota bacterium]